MAATLENPDNLLGNVLRAAHFAARKHAQQRRKGESGEPYVNHLLEVAELLADGEADANLVIAGLLHDAIEDVGVTREEVAREFGDDVAALVVEVTDDKSLPKAQRKALQVANAPKKSARARRLKIADKISNLRAIVQSPPAGWDTERKREYVEWARRVVDACGDVDARLRAEFDRVYDECRRGQAGS